MNGSTTQPNLLELAKQGNAQAIATLMNRQLQPKGITVKANLTNSCLMVIAESTEPPEQSFIVDFVRKGMTNLKVEVIKRVAVRGQATGKNSPAWRETFDLSFGAKAKLIQPSSSVNSQTSKTVNSSTIKPKTTWNFLSKVLSIGSGNRQLERILLVAGTFLATSGLWAGLGLLRPTGEKTLVSAQSVTSGAHTITGKLVVIPYWNSTVAVNFPEGTTCSGNDNTQSGGFDDIDAGAQITVKDNAGKIIAISSLGEGKVVKARSDNRCEFPIKIENVPPSDFYSIEVGHRGSLTFSAQAMEKKGWTVQFELQG
jgi:hypothetical protein